MDADVLVQGDVSNLFSIPWGDNEAIKVVKNELRFEWPSVILFNNPRCTILTHDFVETSACNTLQWASGIGDLPKEWNYLVGYEEECGKPEKPQLVHYTQGLPHYPEALNTYLPEWKKVAHHAMSSIDWEPMMGNSVHAKRVRERLKKMGEALIEKADEANKEPA